MQSESLIPYQLIDRMDRDLIRQVDDSLLSAVKQIEPMCNRQTLQAYAHRFSIETTSKGDTYYFDEQPIMWVGKPTSKLDLETGKVTGKLPIRFFSK